MSHTHQLTLDQLPDLDRILDLTCDAVGLLRHDRHVELVDLTRPDDHNIVHLWAYLSPTGASQRLRNRERTFLLHITDYTAYPDPEGRTPPALEVWGPDPFGLAVLHTIAEVLGGQLVLDDGHQTLWGRLDGTGADHARLVARADVAAAAAALHGRSPHQVRVPALARAGVPTLAA